MLRSPNNNIILTQQMTRKLQKTSLILGVPTSSIIDSQYQGPIHSEGHQLENPDPNFNQNAGYHSQSNIEVDDENTRRMREEEERIQEKLR